ncbi:hypothetical protein IEO21_05567 [Rhodonia placenta]|uniref:Uncharacterized protein n=1 Tax=Rhodonia placenta TaxID=104341 RepID=A0A8H7U1H8_9APHY|nr:hypothetical protein IEO21_05567 [Postia placenta]
MSKFRCWKSTMILVPGPAERRDESSAAKIKTIRSVVVEIFVFSVGGCSARICLCLTHATSFVKTAITYGELYLPRLVSLSRPMARGGIVCSNSPWLYWILLSSRCATSFALSSRSLVRVVNPLAYLSSAKAPHSRNL